MTLYALAPAEEMTRRKSRTEDTDSIEDARAKAPGGIFSKVMRSRPCIRPCHG